MKELIRQILHESTHNRIHNIEFLNNEDFVNWQQEGFMPYVLLDDGKTVEFKILKSALDAKTIFRKYKKNERVYALTEQQAKIAVKFVEPFIQSINLKREQIETMKQLVKGVITQKFMKNDFGEMTPDNDDEKKS